MSFILALRDAIYEENIPRIQEILKIKTLDLNKPYGNSKLLPLEQAGILLNPDIVKLLLDAGANPNQKNSNDKTPFVTTIENYGVGDIRTEMYLERLRTILLFIRYGGNVEDTLKNGTTIREYLKSQKFEVEDTYLKTIGDLTSQSPNTSPPKPLELVQRKRRLSLSGLYDSCDELQSPLTPRYLPTI